MDTSFFDSQLKRTGQTLRSSTEDQKEQADYIIKYLNLLNKARIDGSFYISYNEPYPQYAGLLNSKKRKLGFYAYKSYQVGS
jgi:hypothetical protein